MKDGYYFDLHIGTVLNVLLYIVDISINKIIKIKIK